MKIIKGIIVIISTLIIAIQLQNIFLANTDLINPSWLFVDEDITFSGVKKLHQAIQTSDKGYILDQFLDGGDHRYGRILWNVNALVSFLPSLIWGDEGVIISIRFTQTFFLLVAYYLLAHALIKSWAIRLLTVSLLMLLPNTGYYATMPKPEPFQLFFLALFIWFATKRRFLINGWHWLWLGMATGAKISTLPILAFFELYAIAMVFLGKDKVNIETPTFIKNLLINLLWLAVGFNLAEPIFYIKFEVYQNWIIGNVLHGDDNVNLQFNDWLHFIAYNWTGINTYVIYAVISLIALSTAYSCFRYLKGDTKHLGTSLLLVVGWLVNVLIMLTVKRLWGFYLHIGSVLLVVATISVLGYVYQQHRNIFFRVPYILIMAGVGISCIYAQIRANNGFYDQLANRTQNPTHIFKSKQQAWAERYIIEKHREQNRTLTGYYAPFMYQFRIKPEIGSIRPIWGAFTAYHTKPDFIITDYKLMPDTLNLADNAFKDSYNESARLYQKHVSINNMPCLELPCYKETIIDSLNIYLYAINP